MIETRQIAMKCGSCGRQERHLLTLTQVRRLAASGQLDLLCRACGRQQIWTPEQPVSVADLPPTQAGKSVLLVDDDELILQLLRKVLDFCEAQIDVAANGKEALAKLGARAYDLLVCDVRMPEMNGPELFERIQRERLIAPERIIFLTGDKSSSLRRFLEQSGCSYLYKPIQFLEFSEQVQALLGPGGA